MLVGLVVVVAAAMALFVNLDLRAGNAQSIINSANIEALAGEPGEEEEPGMGDSKTCWKQIKVSEASQVFYCGVCDWVPNSTKTTFSG